MKLGWPLDNLTSQEAGELLVSGDYVVWRSHFENRFCATPRRPIAEISDKIIETIKTKGPMTTSALYNQFGRHSQIDEKDFDVIIKSTGLKLVGNKWIAT